MKIVVFDLDDTLYKEVDFLKSGYRAIASLVNRRTETVHCSSEDMFAWWKEGKNVFEMLESQFPNIITKQEFLDTYRYHKPKIELSEGALDLLEYLKHNRYVIGLISDGRYITQRNKIEALVLLGYISDEDIVISEAFRSEKPAEANYKYFMQRYLDAEYIYIGDNPNKDFVTPNKLGWETFCLLDDGRNIHTQAVNVSDDYKAHHNVSSLSELLRFL